MMLGLPNMNGHKKNNVVCSSLLYRWVAYQFVSSHARQLQNSTEPLDDPNCCYNKVLPIIGSVNYSPSSEWFWFSSYRYSYIINHLIVFRNVYHNDVVLVRPVVCLQTIKQCLVRPRGWRRSCVVFWSTSLSGKPFDVRILDETMDNYGQLTCGGI